MSGRRSFGAAPVDNRRSGAALHHDPLAEEQLLERFYRPLSPRSPAAESSVQGGSREGQDDPLALTALAKKSRPTHYKIVCISLYTQDIERLEQMVDELKRRGHTKANKSQLIRAALDQVDLDKVPKGH